MTDALHFGVTTVLDMGASGVTPSQLSELRATAAGRMDVADLRYAATARPHREATAQRCAIRAF